MRIKVYAGAIPAILYIYNEVETMTPNTSLYICRGIPWNNDYTHVRLFESASAANTYILSKAAFTKTQYSYISSTKQIRADGLADQYRDCNYIAWKNTGYSNKWFYAFITDVTYLADNTCLISFEYDIFQTWFYDTTVNPSYVEREHVDDDTIGANTVPENVVMGDPVNVASSNNYIPHKWYMYATQVFDRLAEVTSWTEPGADGNEVSGYYKLNLTSREQAQQIVKLYTQKGMLESLISMFALTDSTRASSSATYSITRPTEFDGYTPKNNKLLCYPYNYMTLVLAGSETPYRYEYFTDGTAAFNLKAPKYAGGSSYVYPVGYEKESSTTASFALEHSVPTGAYPTASFGANAFQNYLVQYGPQLAVGLIGQVVQLASAVPNIETAGEAVTAGASIANSVLDLRTRSLNSQTVSGTQSVSQLAYDTQLIIRLVSKQILPEYARIIDEYFTAFGYKVCRIKTPNITGRPSWNYVKTIGAQVSGNIPEYAETALKAMLNNGVTFWHTNDVGNYSLDNSI